MWEFRAGFCSPYWAEQLSPSPWFSWRYAEALDSLTHLRKVSEVPEPNTIGNI
jgi:hypothetical protein